MLYKFIIAWLIIGLMTAGIEGTAILYSRHPRQMHWYNMPAQYSRTVAYVSMLIGSMTFGPLSLLVCVVHFLRGRFNVKREGCLPNGMGCFNPACQSCWQSVHEVRRK